MFDLDRHESEFIDALVSKCKSYGGSSEVNNQWIQAKLNVGKTRFHKLKGSLVEKGVLQDRPGCKLTLEAVSQYLTSEIDLRIPTPMEFRLLGQVKAGRTKQDNLRVDMADPKSMDTQAIETRTIPLIGNDSDIFLLEVEGDSMVHIGINQGDYLLVKPFPKDRTPRQGQLIVTRYLLPADVPESRESGDFSYDLLEGPTVKYYHYVQGHTYPHRLTSHLKVEESKFKIYAAAIHADGYVIGVYRDYTNGRHQLSLE